MTKLERRREFFSISELQAMTNKDWINEFDYVLRVVMRMAVALEVAPRVIASTLAASLRDAADYCAYFASTTPEERRANPEKTEARLNEILGLSSGGYQ